ncbi:hypothetical protein ACFE04_008280 [Oxalis oulophora]
MTPPGLFRTVKPPGSYNPKMSSLLGIIEELKKRGVPQNYMNIVADALVANAAQAPNAANNDASNTVNPIANVANATQSATNALNIQFLNSTAPVLATGTVAERRTGPRRSPTD